MAFLIGYVAFLIVFGLMDFAWLSTTVPKLYLPVLGDSAATNMRLAPAIVFYLFYAAGAVFFGALPGVSSGPRTAFLCGLFLGAVAYGTYDLTNYATLRNWSLALTVVDMAWGALATGVACMAASVAMRYLSA
ncbi:DUF2177 family protein [Hyphomicrobium sp. 99]|uniref:DUF2177 family protein n=1 Tax=Hyphomicrobium sp. 99 TaxID=1163419 RepID=UPI0005F85DC3|nr:DUF2177 family protein [Hyphomicrobium sp. 99]